MKTGEMIKFDIKFFYKKIGIIFLLVAVGVLIVNFICCAFANKYENVLTSSAAYSVTLLWGTLFAAKELFDLNYKCSVANCISRKTVIAHTLIGWGLFSAVLSGFTMLCEFLTAKLFAGNEYMDYKNALFFDILDPDGTGLMKGVYSFAFQILIFMLVGYAVLMFCALNSRLSKVALTILWTVAVALFVIASTYADRVIDLINTIGIDLTKTRDCVMLIAVFTAAAALIYSLLFRRITYFKADSK